MDKANDNNNIQSARFIACTPQQLRVIADRLEAAATNSSTKDKVTYPITKDTVFYYDPILEVTNAKRDTN